MESLRSLLGETSDAVWSDPLIAVLAMTVLALLLLALIVVAIRPLGDVPAPGDPMDGAFGDMPHLARDLPTERVRR